MIGGYQRVVWDVCRGLRRRGWEVTLLTTPVPGRPHRFEQDGLDVATVAGARPEALDGSWRRNAARAARELGAFDAVLGAGPAGQAVRLRGAAEVFQCQDVFLHEVGVHDRRGRLRVPRDHWRPWVAAYVAREMEYIRRADRVLVSAPSTKEALGRLPYRLLPRAREARVVRNGIDVGRYRPDPSAAAEARPAFGLRDGDPLVVTVCRLAPGKGVEDALRAFAAFSRAHPGAVHAIVGTGTRADALRQAAAALSPEGRVRFLGTQPDRATVRLLQAADLVLFLPWRAEVRPPLSLMEALACGADVVATETSLDPALPHPRLHPVPPRDPAAAARALEAAWQARGSGGRPAAPFPEELTLERCVLGHEEVLMEALGLRRRLPLPSAVPPAPEPAALRRA
jgi:glycosyltransferase involved in cell wall biosynthesis